MTQKDDTLIRDLFSHWLPAGAFALISFLGVDALNGIRRDADREADERRSADLAVIARVEELTDQQRELARTVNQLRIEVATHAARHDVTDGGAGG